MKLFFLIHCKRQDLRMFHINNYRVFLSLDTLNHNLYKSLSLYKRYNNIAMVTGVGVGGSIVIEIIIFF